MTQIPFEYIVYLFLIMVGIALIIILYLIVQRFLEKRMERKRLTYLSKRNETWYTYLFEDGSIERMMVPRHKNDYMFIETLLNDYLTQFSNEDVLNKISHFASLHLKEYYEEQLRSRQWFHRINAMFRIYKFRIEPLYEACIEVENMLTTEEERYQFLKITSLMDYDLFIQYLKTYSTDLSEYDLKNLLLSLSPDFYQKIKQQLSEMDKRLKLSFIDTLAMRGRVDDVLFLENLLKSSDQETRIRSLKSISEIGVVWDYKKYLSFVDSNVWQERLMLAKVLQYFPINITFPTLEKLTRDEIFIVRQEACETIRKGENGLHLLKEIVETSPDRYAVDAAKEVLARWSNG